MKQSSQTSGRRGIYLVGFSGSGKSTIAQRIAAQLGWRACDLDDLIVARSGMDIPTIFAREGEAGFRSREAEALHAASEPAPFVIATGGGTIVRSENRAAMNRHGWIILLEAEPEVLHARMQRQAQNSDARALRPLLQTDDPLEKIRSLKQTRQSAYALADRTIHTDHLTEEQVVEEVIRAVAALEHS